MTPCRNTLSYYFFIILATGLLYLWQIYHYPAINPDGVTYLESAAAYTAGGMQALLAFHAQADWPLYSMCISKVHQVLGVSIPVAERLLDGLFLLITACSFLYTTRVFSQHKAAYFWATVFWLTWHAYVKWWPQVVRDHGFMASLLFSFCCYYRFVVTQRCGWGLAWAACILVAEAFRLEAMLYLILTPLFLFFLKKHCFSQRCFLWLWINILPIALSLILGILFFTHQVTLHSLRCAYIYQEFFGFYTTAADHFMQALQVTREKIFYRENDYVAYGLMASYTVVFLGYLLAQISVAALFPLFFLRRCGHFLNAEMLMPCLIAYGVVATLTPLLFFIEHMFLNGRYVLPFGVLGLLLAASLMPHALSALSSRKKIYFLVLFFGCLSINFSENIFHFGHSAQEEHVFGSWLKQNHPHQSVFTNEKRIFFYTHEVLGERNLVYQLTSSEVTPTWLRQHTAWCRYHWLVISAPADTLLTWKTLFIELQEQRVLGSRIQCIPKRAGHGEILAAAINGAECQKLVDSQAALT